MSKDHLVAAARIASATQAGGDVAKLGTILSVWAHPDDETYLAGGLMAAARLAGQRVVCATATVGEHGTGDPAQWPPTRLSRVRRWEAAAAMAVLGVGEHHVAGLPDGRLPEFPDEGIAWVERLVDDVEPDTIVTFGPDGITHHADHIAVHRWVTEVWRRRGRSARLLWSTVTRQHLRRFGEIYEAWGVYMTDARPTGASPRHLALRLRLAGPLLDQKLAALRAMATQTSEVLAAIDLATYTALIDEEAFVDAERAAATLTPEAPTRTGVGGGRGHS